MKSYLADLEMPNVDGSLALIEAGRWICRLDASLHEVSTAALLYSHTVINFSRMQADKCSCYTASQAELVR